MKAKLKKYWWVIGLVLLGLGVFFWQNRKIEKQKDTIQILAIENAVLNDTVKVYKDKSGALTFKINSIQIERDNLKASLEESGYSLKELKRRDINWRKINSALETELRVAGQFTTVLRDTVYRNSVDTIRASVFDWNNKYLSFAGRIVNRDVTGNYNYKTSLDVIQSKNIISIYMSDPNATIISGNQFTVTSSKKWYTRPWVWGLAGMVGGYFIAK